MPDKNQIELGDFIKKPEKKDQPSYLSEQPHKVVGPYKQKIIINLQSKNLTKLTEVGDQIFRISKKIVQDVEDEDNYVNISTIKENIKND